MGEWEDYKVEDEEDIVPEDLDTDGLYPLHNWDMAN